MTEGSQLIRGLEGVVAAETRLCDLDGQNGRLAYGGYDIDELARQATFEEVAYLLWHGELPTRAQLDRVPGRAGRGARHPRATWSGPSPSCRATRTRCACCRPPSRCSACTTPTPPTTRAPANLRKAVRLTSQFATAICAHHRVRSGQAPVPPRPRALPRGQLPLHAHRRSGRPR